MKNNEFKLPPLFTKAIILCAIAGLTIFFYWNIKDHQFLNFDDNVYVSANPYVKNGFSLENIKWTFTFTDVSYWQPLTLLSQMLDCQLFGVKPGPQLLVNLAIHIFNALLLFLIILRMTGAQVTAAFIALLFALHPLNVESVAWLVERKTVLSTLFLFGAIYTYLHYTEKKKKWKYALILCLYACGLMSKSAILTFPVLLLLLDYWPLKRFERAAANNYERTAVVSKPINRFIFFWKSDMGSIIVEKLPFLTLSLVSILITMASVLHSRFLVTHELVPIYLRIYNYFVSIIQYLRNIAWPVDLSIFYPFPKTFILLCFLVALSSVVLITILTFITRKKRPWLIMGWLWFLIALLPASGLIQAGLWPALADRFMYIPMIGIFIMVIWEADERLKGRYSQVLKVILFSAMLTYFAFLTRIQNTYFSNSFALFNRCLEVVGDNGLALNNLGETLASLGRTDEAMIYFAKNIKLDPAQANSYHNYGVCLVAKKDDKKAIVYFQKAIALNPNLIHPYIHLSLIQSRAGNTAEAVKFMTKALNIDKNNLDAHYNFGIILAKQGKYEEAISHFSFVIKRDPGNVSARLNLAQAYQDAGLYSQAMAQYETLDKTISHNKGYIYYGIAGVYAQQKKYEECAAYLETSLKDGFNVLEYLESDIRFKNFRKTPAYGVFLENHKIKIP
ncbi:MAG: tetratricopeptide repeat protein [Bacteroidetes bacterium]|nr:tetratricopeptide repeat protein [Bacteroidota bacterium]